MPRGRPIKSDIRQAVIDILLFKGRAYGYELHKIYVDIFPMCTREVIYYHLRKGLKLGEFEVESVIQEKGQFSWGQMVEKIYYRLGPNANPSGNEAVKRYFEAQKKILQK